VLGELFNVARSTVHRALERARQNTPATDPPPSNT
jgi:hypothetical protein